jgi:hypothetical protein
MTVRRRRKQIGYADKREAIWNPTLLSFCGYFQRVEKFSAGFLHLSGFAEYFHTASCYNHTDFKREGMVGKSITDRRLFSLMQSIIWPVDSFIERLNSSQPDDR